MPAPPEAFLRRENATNGAQHSRKSCGDFISVPVANRAIALVQVEIPRARPGRSVSPGRFRRGRRGRKIGMPLDSAGRTR
jgi:hypothetical protein